MTATESKWTTRIAEWRSSGKTAEAFAEGKGFAPSTLRYWASVLRTAARKKEAVPMARVVRQQASPSSGSVEVIVGNARVVLSRGFDAELLRDVMRVLGGAR